MLKAMSMGFIGILPYMVALFGLWMIYKVLHDRITHYDDDGEIKAHNEAAGINRAGAYVGIGIAASGSLIGSDLGFWADLGMFILDGLAAILVFTVAKFVMDWVILHQVRNIDQVAAGNKAVAMVEAFSMVSLGIIGCASFSGGGQNVWAGLGSATLFSSFGVILLASVYWLFSLVYRLQYKCSVSGEIESGNTAMAKEVGGMLLAMSIALWFSISGDFTGWVDDIVYFLIAAISSMASVLLAWFLSGRLLTRTPSVVDGVHQHNDAAAILKMGAMVAFGLTAGLVTFS